ncbi:MAG: glycosyltransferase, partial [Muribaculaceae bacterium]|nr:glycosyltransferase [Muribaculaceae bacterium]
MEKQISIIIPTYNMEKYIGKCLDSLLIPEFDQVEVLVVNDGSKDRSSEIAHSYADRYPGSIRVIDKPNGNYGSCINAALPLATGRYVKVLDADDTFDTETFSKFVALIENVDDDMLITPFVDVDEEGVITRRDTENYYNVNLYSTYAFEEIKDSALALYPTMHRLTYKRSLFDRLDYRQTEGISYTDTEWSMLPMAYIDTIRFTDIYLYR